MAAGAATATSYMAPAIISAVGSVAGGILGARNQKTPGPSAPSLGSATQMQPQMGSFQDLSPNAAAVNPAFGQFLGG